MGSTQNTIVSNNVISNNSRGINLDSSYNNTVTKNVITHNSGGVHFQNDCSYNTILENWITSNNGTGISLRESELNNITSNNITKNGRGVYTEYCGVNTIHHNNFINNTQQWFDIAVSPWPITLEFSKTSLNESATSSAINFILVTLLALGITLIPAFYIVRHFTKSIVGLVSVFREVAKGNIDVELDTSSKDEIGELARATSLLVESTKDLTKAADSIGCTKCI